MRYQRPIRGVELIEPRILGLAELGATSPKRSGGLIEGSDTTLSIRCVNGYREHLKQLPRAIKEPEW